MITPRPTDAEPVEPSAAIPLIALARLPHVQTVSAGGALPTLAAPPNCQSTLGMEVDGGAAVKLDIAEPELKATGQGGAAPAVQTVAFDKVVEAASDGPAPANARTALPLRLLKLHEWLAPHSGLIMAAAVMLAAMTLGWLNVMKQPAESRHRSSVEHRQAAWRQGSAEASQPESEAMPGFDSLVKKDLTTQGRQVAALVRLGEPIPGDVAPTQLPSKVAEATFPSTGMPSPYLTGTTPVEKPSANSPDATAKMAQRPGEESR